MSRFLRLCLDAVERCGDPYVSTLNIIDYVERRRWMFSRASVYVGLSKLEDLGFIQGLTITYGRRVYKRTAKPDLLEVVPLAPRAAR